MKCQVCGIGIREGQLCCLCEIQMMDLDSEVSRSERLSFLKELYKDKVE